MKLPTWMTTVTTLSRILALIMIIGFIFLSFYLGFAYQENILTSTSNVTILVKEDSKVEETLEEVEKILVPTDKGDISNDWSLVINDYGYSLRYPEQIADATYSQDNISTAIKLKEFEEIQLTDKGTSYWIGDKLYELSTFLHIESLAKEDLDMEAIATKLLEIMKNNENIYVETVQEPIETTFKGKEAYTLSVLTSEITYINADGTSSGGILGSDGVIKSYVVDNGDRYLVISYYDTAIYQMILETFEFTP